WRELQRLAGEQLLYITGSIDAGPPDSAVFQGSLLSAQLHNLPHEILTSAELTSRFPGYHLPASTVALLQPEGGFLLPERCIVAHVVAAQALGAEIHGRERVLEWKSTSDGIVVQTDRGSYVADRVVISAGAWTSSLVDGMDALDFRAPGARVASTNSPGAFCAGTIPGLQSARRRRSLLWLPDLRRAWL
ncbi:MAG TPA: FAD-dependent oxidoreductase, partial [Chloroflexota bacterium]|nr:FAD-dependent oxidoreductase [Chloroflexota bacterium]